MRGDFTTVGTPKACVANYFRQRVKTPVKTSPWPFCKWILAPTKAILATFDFQRCQGAPYFASRSGWLDTIDHCQPALYIRLNLFWNCELFVLKRFFYLKNDDKNACFWCCSWSWKTSNSKFATNQTTKLDRNQGFLLQKLDANISASYWLTKCQFNDALMIDLQILKFFKDIGRCRHHQRVKR